MLRAIGDRRAFAALLFGGLLACADADVAKGASDAAIESSAPVRREFEEKYAAWERHREKVSFSSDSRVYASGPEFEAIVAMGKGALPMVMEKIAAGNIHMNKAAQRITGIDVAPRGNVDPREWPPGARPFGARNVSERWLKWWEEHRNDPQWRP